MSIVALDHPWPWAGGCLLSDATSGGSAAVWASDDDKLIAAVQGGSEEAFSALVARHQQALRAFLRRTCGDWSLADDMAQEVFLIAWTGMGKLKPGSNLRAWLCGVGYRKALTAMRSDRRARRRDHDYLKSESFARTEAPEDRMSLEAAMGHLPVDQRACVALCLGADFTHAEAALALDMPLGTVKSHVQRGRARLLQALGVSDDAG